VIGHPSNHLATLLWCIADREHSRALTRRFSPRLPRYIRVLTSVKRGSSCSGTARIWSDPSISSTIELGAKSK
jgi:hypothetical protein